MRPALRVRTFGTFRSRTRHGAGGVPWPRLGWALPAWSLRCRHRVEAGVRSPSVLRATTSRIIYRELDMMGAASTVRHGSSAVARSTSQFGRLKTKQEDGSWGVPRDAKGNVTSHVTESVSYTQREGNEPIGVENVDFEPEGPITKWEYSWSWDTCRYPSGLCGNREWTRQGRVKVEDKTEPPALPPIATEPDLPRPR